MIGALFGNNEAWYKGYHFQIKEMFVDPKYQRSGIGSIMMTKIEGIMKKKNVKAINLLTTSKYWVKKFYLKHKYRTISDMQLMIKYLEK